MRVLVLLALFYPAVGFSRDGNLLLRSCGNFDYAEITIQKMSYIAMTMAVVDYDRQLAAWEKKEPRFCTPDGATDQPVRVVIKFMEENPELLHFSTVSMIANALTTAFPPSFKDDGTKYCPKKPVQISYNTITDLEPQQAIWLECERYIRASRYQIVWRH